MPGMEGTREIETQTQSPLSLHFLLVPVISQTQPEAGRQRSLADALQRSQPPGVQSRWKLDLLGLMRQILGRIEGGLRNWGWPLTTSQQEAEALSPRVHKKLNTANNHMSRPLPSQVSDGNVFLDNIVIKLLWDPEAENLAKLGSDSWPTETMSQKMCCFKLRKRKQKEKMQCDQIIKTYFTWNMTKII